MPRTFSLAYLTVPGTGPCELIRMARDAGYDYVSLRTIPMGQPGEPQVHLEEDPALFEKVRQTLQECDMKVLDIELVRVREDLPEDCRPAFEKGAALGAGHVLCSVWTKDLAFAAGRLSSVCKQAAEFGLTVDLEFPVLSEVKTLRDTVELMDKVGAPNLKILMDMIYVHLDGNTFDSIRNYSSEKYGMIHLCDWPKETGGLGQTELVRGGRAYVGEGAADIAAYIKALPEDLPISIELPNLAEIEKRGNLGHARRCLETAKEYFAKHGI